MSFFKNYYKKINIPPPLCHFVLGSGFSRSLDKIKELELFKNWEEKKSCSFTDIPQLPAPTVKSHAGLYRFFVHKKSNQTISFQCGRLHLYEGHSAQTVAEPVMQIFLAGTKHFILSNISGGLKKEHTVGTVVALKDHVNFTGVSPLIGPEKTTAQGKKLGHRFPDMSQVYDSQIRKKISEELLKLKIRVSPGVYVGLCGPELETPAQIEWLNKSSKGLFDAVGMSTVLEAIALKQAGAKLAGFSVIANPACGIDPNYKELSFSQMLANIEESILKVLQAYFHYSEIHLP
ncbi:MAG: purine-nucleoside phosphorylase [Oligoflexia bacterium]|nr:purine-nucleoside phosphorylase [Oligoflexia bacterium]